MPDGSKIAQDVRLTTRVFVEDLRIEAMIGVLDHEQGGRQPLLIETEMDVIPPARDELHLALDYRLVAEIAETLAGQQTGLIEIFAERLARRLLDEPLVTRVRVQLRKPQALTNGMAGTTITLSREH